MKHATGAKVPVGETISSEDDAPRKPRTFSLASSYARRRGPYDHDRKIPQPGSRLLPRPKSEVCRIETSQGRINRLHRTSRRPRNHRPIAGASAAVAAITLLAFYPPYVPYQKLTVPTNEQAIKSFDCKTDLSKPHGYIKEITLAPYTRSV